MLKDPHDKLFKATFSQVRLAAEELKAALPGGLVKSVDWDSLRVVRSSLFGPELAQMCSDILYSARIAGRTGYLKRWHRLVKTFLEDPQGLWALAQALSYIMEVTDAKPEPFRHFLRTEFGRAAEEAFMTGAEQLTREARERALAHGIRQGKIEGKVEGKAELVLKQLALRFGQVSTDVVARIRTASIADLDLWAERIIDAKSLTDVFRTE
jgi:predicted transposase YdaD